MTDDPPIERGTDRDTDRARAADAVRFDPSPWRAELLSFARRMGAARDAEDVVHEAFVRVLAAPPSRASLVPRAYLYRAVLAVIADRARRHSVRGGDAADAPDGVDPRGPHEADPLELAERHELATLAARAVARLPAKQRAALLLRVVRHMDYDEIAMALDGSVATARQHFYLAVKAVRDALACKSDETERGVRRPEERHDARD